MPSTAVDSHVIPTSDRRTAARRLDIVWSTRDTTCEYPLLTTKTVLRNGPQTGHALLDMAAYGTRSQ